jgi:hypothetical protein
MTNYEECRLDILRRAKLALPYEYLVVNTWLEADRYKIPEPHVREILLKLAQGELIALEKWDSERVRPISEWKSVDAFFNSTHEGFVRVRLLSRGGELLEKQTSPIGFTAKP